MKNIIIAGSARSGKTTLASMLKERYPSYNLFHGDCVREWFVSMYGKQLASTLVHSDRYADAMILLADAILRDSEHLYIIEWSRFFPSSVAQLSICNQCRTIYLGHGGMDPKVLMKQCRQFERKNDFTSVLSDTDLLAACERWAKVDLKMIKECKQHGETYYNTSVDRDAVLQAIARTIFE